MPLAPDHAIRIARARRSLEGLATGDAFGERFFGATEDVTPRIRSRILPKGPWPYTDDTAMALSIFELLEARGGIDEADLAARFAARYARDPMRGYGAMAHRILRELQTGLPWRLASSQAFGGQGSKGNGSAMRAGPIGGYFCDSLPRVAEEARRSAVVTHYHPEGQAGAIAVAVAAGYAADQEASGEKLLQTVVGLVPPGATRAGIEHAASIPFTADVMVAVEALGNGSHAMAEDTVPFALWCAARHLGHLEEALWTTVSGLGDRDTTCAIVGSIVSMFDRGHPLPTTWLDARESLGPELGQTRHSHRWP